MTKIKRAKVHVRRLKRKAEEPPWAVIYALIAIFIVWVVFNILNLIS